MYLDNRFRFLNFGNTKNGQNGVKYKGKNFDKFFIPLILG